MQKIKMTTHSSLEKIAKNACCLPEIEKKGSMLMGETYNFQVAVWGPCDIENVTVRFTGEIADYAEYYVQKDILAGTPYGNGADMYVLHDADNMFPELLQENKIFSLKKGEYTRLWVSVFGNVPVGIHTLSVQLYEQEKALAETQYDIEVIDKKLPKLDLALTNWMHYDCICDFHDVEAFTPAFYQILEKYLQAYTDMGMNMLLIPIFTPALDTAVGSERKTMQLLKIKKSGDTYAFDYSLLDEFIQFIQKRGIEYFELAHLFTQWGAKFCPKIMAEVDGVETRIFGWDTESTSKAYKDFLTALLPDLVKHLKELGILENTYVHLSDEPNEDALETYSELYHFVKKLIGDTKTFDALSHYAFYEKGVVDMPVVLTSATREFMKNKVPHFAYYCCEPYQNYESNRFFAMPSERTRVIGMQLYKNGAKGFLHWGFNFYYTQFSARKVNPYEETNGGGRFPSGDSYIVYPREHGVLKSVRYYLLKEGFDDYRTLKLAEKLCGKEQVEKLLKKYGVISYNAYPHSPYLFKNLKEELNQMIKATPNKLR